jgi:hypothetical protein
VPHSLSLFSTRRIHRRKIYFYCLLFLHTTFPSPPTISQLIILYDWKIFLLDTIDGTLETDSERWMDVAWCLWHSQVNCRLNFKLDRDRWKRGVKSQRWLRIICKVLIDDITGLGGEKGKSICALVESFFFWFRMEFLKSSSRHFMFKSFNSIVSIH